MSRDASSDDLHADIARGTLWVGALRLFARGLGFISTIILARLLIPDDFGLVALASVIIGSVGLLGAFNFDVWLVRHRNPQREDYDTVWTLSMLRDLFIALVIALLAAPAARWFGDLRLEIVLQVLAVSTVLAAFRNIGVVDFRRDMEFDREFKLFGLARLRSFLVTLALALTMRSYWALVGGMVASALMALSVLHLLTVLETAPPWLQLPAGISVDALVFVVAIIALWYLDRPHAGGENIVISFLSARLNRAASPTAR